MWLYSIIFYFVTGFVIVFFTRAKDVIQKSVEDTDLKSVPVWKSILFITILFGVAILVWPAFIKSWFFKPRSVWDELNENSIFKEQNELFESMQDLCADGIDSDEFLEGYGEFGMTTTNPIPCNTVIGASTYLSGLVSKDGSEVFNVRIGSFSSEITSQPIDGYKITDSNGNKLAILYVSPYQKRNSCKAPRGFKQVN